MRLLLDTNITIDILTNRQPFCHDSIECYKKALLHGDKVFISTVSVADIMYITRSKFSPVKAIAPADFISIRNVKNGL